MPASVYLNRYEILVLRPPFLTIPRSYQCLYPLYSSLLKILLSITLTKTPSGVIQ